MQKLTIAILTILFSLSGLATTLEVLENARYAGSYGMKVQFDGTSSSYVQNDSPIAETRYRARFYLRLNDINILEGESFELFCGFNSSDAKQFILNIVKSSGSLYLQSSVKSHSGTYTNLIQSPALTSGWHSVEIDWLADASAGYLKMWFDGSQSTDISGLDNHSSVIDYVRLGAPSGVPAGATGSHDFDLFESRRLTYIGLECHTSQEVDVAIHTWRPTYLITDLVQWLHAQCP